MFTDEISAGQVAHDAFHSGGASVTRGVSYEDLRPNAQRLWELGAVAAARDTNLVPGRAMYEGYFEATGLSSSTFMPWTDISPSAKLQWEAAGMACIALQKKVA